MSRSINSIFLFLLGCAIYTTSNPQEKVCKGTNFGSRGGGTFNLNYQEYYKNCTFIVGNLELARLHMNAYWNEKDQSFLDQIREVTGYVIIDRVGVDRLVFPNLRVIRGESLAHDSRERFGLLIRSVGKSLEFPQLREVRNGKIGLIVANFCQELTVNWNRFFRGDKSRVIKLPGRISFNDCEKCDPSCSDGCWGKGADKCQKFPETNCYNCSNGCFGQLEGQCCHSSCASGCTGPTNRDCVACKNVYDDGSCKDECFKFADSNWKLNYGGFCVDKCPAGTLVDEEINSCVEKCPLDKMPLRGKCIPCSGTCKKCHAPYGGIIHSQNIEEFRNCTVIEGSLKITDTIFTGHTTMHLHNLTQGDSYPGMDPSNLEILSSVKEITGTLEISSATHQNFTSLYFLRNLEIIGGKREKMEKDIHDLMGNKASLRISKTSLKTLKLNSLKKVVEGNIIITGNGQLCYADEINWDRIGREKYSILVGDNSPNKKCHLSGAICEKRCSDDGCWGNGKDDCVSFCYKLGDFCEDSCPDKYYADEERHECLRCNEECEYCVGPKVTDCIVLNEKGDSKVGMILLIILVIFLFLFASLIFFKMYFGKFKKGNEVIPIEFGNPWDEPLNESEIL